MRIESIRLSNFRQLRNLELRFNRQSHKKDLHIIHANNGVGKTNVLNALTWCLYGSESHLQNHKYAQEKLNAAVCSEIRQQGGGKADVCVEISLATDDSCRRIIFKRVAVYNITSISEICIDNKFTIKILENNEWKNVISDEEQMEIINKYVPETINKYILFDGEQLEKFFNTESMDNVKKGINELTQASYLQKTSKALYDYLRDNINPQLENAQDSNVSNQQKKLNEIQNLINECNDRIDASKHQINVCEEEIEKASTTIRNCESVKDKMSELENLDAERDQLLKDCDKKRKELWKEAQILFRNVAIAPSIKSYFEYIKKQESYGKLPPRVDRSILEYILNNHKCPICNSDNPDMDFVRELEKSLDIATGTASILNKSIGALCKYDIDLKKCANQKDNYSKELKVLENKAKELDEKIKAIDQYLRNFPDKEAIVDAIDCRERFKKEKDRHNRLIGAEENKRSELIRQYKDADTQMQRLLSKNKELVSLSKRKEFCEICRRIIDETQTEILSESRIDMQNETFRIFNRLMWKQGVFSKVEIGEDYSFKLYDALGNQTLGSCSAAETALLALSFTLALQDISKHDSLLFIDTPIGRVDPQNRENFMRTLLEVAERKQVILTFTPSEYDSEVKSIISPEYSSFNQLIQEEGQTMIL